MFCSYLFIWSIFLISFSSNGGARCRKKFKNFGKLQKRSIQLARGRASSLATRTKFPFHVRSAKTLKVNRGKLFSKNIDTACAQSSASDRMNNEGCSMIKALNMIARNAATSEFSGIRGLDLSTLREAIPLWFAISSPLIGVILGFLGAWLVA